jgi:hypothetical protein
MRLRFKTASVLIGTAGLLLSMGGAVGAQAAFASSAHQNVSMHSVKSPKKSAKKPKHKKPDPKPVKKSDPPDPPAPSPICILNASPTAFVEQGLGATNSSVAFVFNVECQPEYGEATVELHTPQLNNACHDTLSWYSASADDTPSHVDATARDRTARDRNAPDATAVDGTGESFDVTLDDDGNAEAVVWGGPSCGATSALVEASLDTAPYVTAVTIVDIKPPTDTPPGLTIWPAQQIEDSVTSSVATIFYAEYPSAFSEDPVEFSDAQLFDRCAGGITWVGADEKILGHGKSVVTDLDNNGNAFVVAVAGPSCASGETLGTIDLVDAPYTTYANIFTVLSPRDSVDP